ncbi:MAG: hypothetical protein LBS69_06280 [Prevotellaceae bacterium]|jgi:chromosomal replication initiation ATPase DnaA|nr:hypothetical protein [Prevotellaceae bacterium]
MDLNTLIADVAASANVTVEQIKSDTRTSEIALARQAFCYLAESARFNHKDIAKVINRSEATIYYSIRVIKGYIDINDGQTRRLLNQLIKKVW